MSRLVNLKLKPYFLSDQDIEWVETTINNMTLEEKIGQLFFQLFHKFEEDDVKDILSKYHLGGARYFTKPGEDIAKLSGWLQKHSKIPMLIACNCDNGGDGACSDGTYIASGAHCEATNEPNVSYNAGYVSGKEATAIGCNWNFDPCSDILLNWRNTIVNTRAYGTNPDTVLKHIRSYIKGLKQSNIISTIKHFPGDGSEERDQHLVLGVNELSVEDWNKTYGKVFKTIIDDGIDTIMAGHIAQPAWTKKINPEISYNDIMPATLQYELIQVLLKEVLDFNGLVITDASHMLGMTAAMKRKDYVPKAIAAGCDMFLFMNEMDEDFKYMMDGYKNGIISNERLHDALRRILGLKAKLGLHRKSKEELQPNKDDLKVLGCDDFKKMAYEAADKGITLVKDTLNQLPITPQTHLRIKLYVLKNDEKTVYGDDQKQVDTIIKEKLEKVGFKVTINEMGTRIKGSIEQYKKDYDAAFVFSDIRGYAVENNYRIRWSCAMGNEIPWYVWEVPTVFVSLNYTTHLTDVPMIKTFINAYNKSYEILDLVIEKIMGKSEFKGIFNELVWCNKWETKR